MTTIAYNHKSKEIAYDSRLTSDNNIMTDSAEKMFKKGDRLFFMSGTVGHYDMFFDWILDGIEPDEDIEVNCYMVLDGAVYWVCTESGKCNISPVNYNDSIGSGYAFALSAMDFGKSAKESVDYAKTRCCKTGGKTKVYKL